MVQAAYEIGACDASLDQAGAQHSQSPVDAESDRWLNQHGTAKILAMFYFAHSQKVNEQAALTWGGLTVA
jgi:hypothetical protein